MANTARVFVSHSHHDNETTDRVVADLRAAGADVWVDTAEIAHDDFQARINAGLMDRDWLILIESPDSLHSPWVRREVNAALQLKDQGRLNDVIPFRVKPCAPTDVPPLWAILHHYDATVNYPRALQGLLNAIGLKQVASDPFGEPQTPGATQATTGTVPPQAEATAPFYPTPSLVYPPTPPTAPTNPVPAPYAPAVQRPRTAPVGWIVAVVLSVVLVIVICSVLVINLSPSGTSTVTVPTDTPFSAPTDTPAPPATNTPAVTTVFNGTLTTSLAGWPNTQNCFFGSDGYHVARSTICWVPTNPLSDVGVEVSVALVGGQSTDYFGLALRGNTQATGEADYRFTMDGGGDWRIEKCFGNGNCSTLSSGAANSAVHTGFNTSNVLDVTAVGSQLDFQVNNQTIGQANDATYARGAVGLECIGSSEVVFTNLTILT